MLSNNRATYYEKETPAVFDNYQASPIFGGQCGVQAIAEQPKRKNIFI